MCVIFMGGKHYMIFGINKKKPYFLGQACLQGRSTSLLTIQQATKLQALRCLRDGQLHLV